MDDILDGLWSFIKGIVVLGILVCALFVGLGFVFQ